MNKYQKEEANRSLAMLRQFANLLNAEVRNAALKKLLKKFFREEHEEK